MKPRCRACQDGSVEVLWTYPDGVEVFLCAADTDSWLDRVDAHPESEPSSVRWLDGSRTLAGVA